MDNHDIKYFLYARRSVEKKDGEEKIISVESQLKEMRELGKREGLKIIKTFEETKSAKYPGRPVFGEMIKRIQKGEAQGIICFKIDRLARNPLDEGTVKYLLRERIIKHIRASDRSWFPEDNALIASVEFGVADQFSRDLGKHVKRGIRVKLEKGDRPGVAPLGYKNSKLRLKGEETVLVDEERFPLVRKIFDFLLSGKYSALAIWKIATNDWLLRNRRGGKIARSQVYNILSNPYYYGMFEWPVGSGTWYKGNHTPMITEEEYDVVQYLLGRKGQPRPKTHIFAYTGLMKCGQCGASITASEKWKHQRNGNVHHYIYYHCTRRVSPGCTQIAVTEKALEKEILDFLSRIEIPPEFHEWAIEELKIRHEREKKDRNSVLHNQQLAYDKVISDLDMILELRMAKELTAEDYAVKKAKLEKDKLTLKKNLDTVDERVDQWLEKAEEFYSLAETARAEFQAGDLEKRKSIFAKLGSHHLLRDKILTIQTEKPVLVIERSANEVRRIHERLEPTKNVADKEQLKKLYSKNLTLCAGEDSNLHGIAPTCPSSMHGYQLRHPRVSIL